jgi:hypothetical protein
MQVESGYYVLMNSKACDAWAGCLQARFAWGFTVWERRASPYRFLSLCGKEWAVSADFSPVRRLVPLILGVVTLAAVVLLFVQDAAPQLFPAGSHEFLAAFSLAMIALAYMVFQVANRAAAAELAKAILLAAAFVFWAANQFWPNLPQAGLFNDIAIGLFVLDVFLVIGGWPREAKVGSFAESGGSRCGRCDCGCGCANCG